MTKSAAADGCPGTRSVRGGQGSAEVRLLMWKRSRSESGLGSEGEKSPLLEKSWSPACRSRLGSVTRQTIKFKHILVGLVWFFVLLYISLQVDWISVYIMWLC